MTPPRATVIVPARQEAADIAACIDAIAAQDLPLGLLEVIVVDGGSTDDTADIARACLSDRGFHSAVVLTNPEGTASSNLNVGLARASGEVVGRVDARTRIEPHYVRTCVELLEDRPDVAVVGGAQVALARDRRARSLGIARALNNRWSMGGSRYRRATGSGPSDTVYLGAFRRTELLEVGGWDEGLVSNQDFDLNQRLSARGLVWFESSLRSGYVPRARLRQLWRQYLRFGRAKVRYWRHARTGPQPRQWVLVAAPPLAAALGVGALALATPAATAVGVAAAAAALTVVEARGTSGPRGGVLARATGLAAMGCIAGGWWLGVVGEVLRPSPERPGSDLRAIAS